MSEPVASTLSLRSAGVTIVAQALGRAVTLLVVLAGTAIVTRAAGPASYADWATVLSLVALFGVVLDPGISPIIVRRLAQDPDSAPRAQALARIRLGLGVLALAVTVAVTMALRGADVVLLAVVLGAQVVPRALVLNIGAWLQADHRLQRQVALEAVCAAVGLALLVLVSRAGGGIVLLALVGFTVPAVLLSVLMQRELRLTPSSRLGLGGDQRAKVRSVLVEVRPLALALLLVALYTRLQVVPLNAAAGSQEVAEYLLAFQVVEQVVIVASIVSGALLPLLATRTVGLALLEGRDVERAVLGVTALGLLGTVALLVLAGPVMRLLGGPELSEGAAGYLRALAPMSAVVLPAFLVGVVHVAQGRGDRYLRINVVALAFNLAAHAVFTLQAGAEAASRITWMTELLVLAVALSPMAWRPRLGVAALVGVAILLAEVVA